MTRLFIVGLLGLCIPTMVAADDAEAEHEPSKCAQGMPGAKGTFDFDPPDHMPGETTFWKDTDGIAPATPGCHIGTDREGQPNGRSFGEACLPNGLLVESNPGAYIIHSHSDDIGHPDTFDCNEWCIGTGASEGVCAMVYYDEAPAPCTQSARCACN